MNVGIIIAIAFVLLIPTSVFGQTAEEYWQKAKYDQLTSSAGLDFNTAYSSYVMDCLEFASQQDRITYYSGLNDEQPGSSFLVLQRLCPYHEDEFRAYFNMENPSEPKIELYQNELQTQSIEETNGGGCLIATATYGSELAQQVQQLRELRDNKLLQTESGTSFMNSFNEFYYSFSPYIADYERENPIFKEAVKIILTPLLTSLSILNHINMDSEESVLGYGVSLIILNIGMYFVAPTIVVVGIRKQMS
jgi:hypothetical protein